ncbi:Vacuolar fusion protein mon1 [Tulasnella sp. 417]|nr:Vacuolar fusion protein mon1 [Tulasnella sp. 417]
MASYVGTPSVASSASSVINVSVDDSSSGMVVTGGDPLEAEGELVVPSTATTADGVEVGDANTALKETLKKTLMQSNGSSKTTEDDITSAMGIMQAIISIYADDGDKIRCINAGSTRITFLLRPPLYYVCVSPWGEPESVTRLHLEYLHLQILSVVTGSQLARIFEKRTNFDLRRLLDGTERFLHSLLTQLELDMGMITSSLNVVRVDPLVRAKVAEVMVPPKDLKDTLYILLLADNRVVTLVRPKKHSVHPADLHILLNTLSRSALSSVTGPDASTWLPICLPKFNPNGFLHAYVSYLVEPDTAPADERPTRPAVVEQKTMPLLVATPKQGPTRENSSAETPEGGSPPKNEEGGDEGNVGEDRTSPVDISADTPTSTSQREPPIPAETASIQSSREGKGEGEPKDPTRATSQPVDPIPKVSLAVVTADREGFEKLPKSAVVSAANAVSRWVKKHEGELVLKDAPVF